MSSKAQLASTSLLPNLFRYFIAAVWLINGLFCKILNLVPRHQQIVARILSEGHAALLTKTIGAFEVLMAVWVISRIHSRFATIIQIVLVATMNIIEFVLAADLLLFGKMNIVVAGLFILVLLLNEIVYRRNISSSTFIQ